jgi:hypothetical protein
MTIMTWSGVKSISMSINVHMPDLCPRDGHRIPITLPFGSCKVAFAFKLLTLCFPIFQRGVTDDICKPFSAKGQANLTSCTAYGIHLPWVLLSGK